ncbi:stalk domain-containing protein [Paenibacillus silvisoli]|uniref:stalk domain-containing protein n=1 Tax=Paenibacillus silvisoli TaxID=3110539 RepID=UPI0028049006|nr:stalk domain-containing protein [Paenibacillus silvisoli]
MVHEQIRRRRLARLLIAASLLATILTGAGLPGDAYAEQSAAVTVQKPDNRFLEVEAGKYYSLALRSDGSVWTWGRNLWSELGIQEQMTVTSIAVPTRLSGLGGIVSIATNGSGYQLAAKADGTVWEWGRSMESVLHGIKPRQVTGISGITKVEAGGTTGLGIKKDGTVWTWPREGTAAFAAGKGPAQAAGIAGAVQVTSYGDIASAVTKDGAVWMWSASGEDAAFKPTKPIRVPGLPKMKQIAMLWDTVNGVDENGRAWSWTYSRTMNGNMVKAIQLDSKAKQAHSGMKMKEVKAGDGTVLFVTTSGQVWTDSRIQSGKLTKRTGLPAAQAVAAGDYHGLALDANGKIWGWGADKWNEIGTPPTSPDGMIYKPVPVSREINMMVNGKELGSIFPAIQINGSVFVPLKDAALAAGASFQAKINTDFQQVMTLEYKGNTAELMWDKTKLVVNGKESEMKSPIESRSGVTLVPCSLLKMLGFSISWDAGSRTVSISG